MLAGFSWLHFFKKNLHLFLSSAWSTAIHNVCNEGKYNLQQRRSVPPGLWILTSKWKTFCSFCLKSIKSIDECTRPGPVGFLHGFLHFVSLSFLFHTIWPGFSPSLVKVDHQAWRFKKLDWVFFSVTSPWITSSRWVLGFFFPGNLESSFTNPGELLKHFLSH